MSDQTESLDLSSASSDYKSGLMGGGASGSAAPAVASSKVKLLSTTEEDEEEMSEVKSDEMLYEDPAEIIDEDVELEDLMEVHKDHLINQANFRKLQRKYKELE